MWMTDMTLSDKELLQEFLPAKSVTQLIQEHQNIYNVIMEPTERELTKISGIGTGKAKRILMLRALVQRVGEVQRKQVKEIHSPDDAMQYFRFLKDKQQEEMWVLLLNTKNHVIGSQLVTRGTINASFAEPREIFYPAVKKLAAAILVAHCHPSGECHPSEEDTSVTKRLIEVGELLKIPLLDHVVIGKYGSYSFREEKSELFMGGIN